MVEEGEIKMKVSSDDILASLFEDIKGGGSVSYE
jgi:hypothetical protein